jgi:hypothetical protein
MRSNIARSVVRRYNYRTSVPFPDFSIDLWRQVRPVGILNNWLDGPGPDPPPPPPPEPLKLIYACVLEQRTPEGGELELAFIPDVPTLSFGISFPTQETRDRCVLIFTLTSTQTVNFAMQQFANG